MSRRTGVLISAKAVLGDFADKHPSVSKCTCNEGKTTGSSHFQQPNAVVTRIGDFNIVIYPDYLFVGVRHQARAFSCRLATTDPNSVKKDLVKALKQYH